MSYDRFLIAPLNTGLETDLKSWMIPEDSFAELNNAYVFRGRVKKRFGSQLTGTNHLNSRLRINLTTMLAATTVVVGKTDGAGAFNGIVPDICGFHVGQKFVVGAVTFTINALGNPDNMTDSSGIVPTHTIDTDTGQLIFVGAAATTDIVFYPYFTTTGVTNGAGTVSGWIPGSLRKVGQMFSIGTEVFTVYNPAVGDNAMYSSTGVSTTHTYNLANGFYNFVAAAPTTTVYFYPSEPVMGLTMYENAAVNNHQAYAFDTQFAYRYSGGSWNQFGPTAGSKWHSANTDFFWSCNWQGVTDDQFALFTTNFKATINGAPAATDDPIWYYNGTTWATFNPIFTPLGSLPGALPVANRYVATAKLIINFKDRLLLLNTIENDGTIAPGVNKAYVNRCRFSHAASPLSTTAWWEPNIAVGANYATGGGYIDAPTMEEIVSASFIKDRLIVYFERSTWELAYTGNQVLPFIWNKLNTELGVEGTFSVVPFDKVVLGIGTTGVQACNGSNVERIDDKIPDKIFDILHKPDAVKRIAGVRDYKTEMVYWAVSNNPEDSSAMYPDTVLVYNYKNNSWAFNRDSFTAFGYFEQQDGRTWATSTFPWATANFSWSSGVSRANYRRIIAGNQQGWVLGIEPDETKNAPSLYITNIATPASTVLTIVDHNLADGDYIKITGTGLGALDDKIFKVNAIKIAGVIDPDNINIGATNFVGVYAGGGIAARVSRIDIVSKQWNPYISQGRNFYLAKVDFCTQKTSAGKITVDYSPSSTNPKTFSLIDYANATNSNLGTNVLETSWYPLVPLEEFQERTWHPIYFQGEGEFVQLRLYFSDLQMQDVLVTESAFELEGLTLYCMPTSQRLG